MLPTRALGFRCRSWQGGMAVSRRTLRFHCVDSRMGLDSRFARICGRSAERDCVAREVSEGSAILFDSAVWLAFLGSVCRVHLDSAIIRHAVLRSSDGGEALIEKCFPENLARWQSNW